MNAILNLLVSLVLYAVVIYIVSRLNLGLSVDGFVGAFIAGAGIAVVAWLVNWLLSGMSFGGWFGALVSLVVAAVVLFDRRQICTWFEGKWFRRRPGSCRRYRRRSLVGRPAAARECQSDGRSSDQPAVDLQAEVDR